MRLIVILFSCTLLNSPFIFGNHNYEICGRVSDSISQKYVRDVAIQLVNKNSGNVSVAIISDSSGRFCLNKLEKAPYRLYISCLGYVPQEIDVKIPSKGNFSYVKIYLKKSEIQLDEITVKGMQSGMINSVDRQIFLPDSIHLEHAVTAYDVIKKVPGIRVKPSDKSIQIPGKDNVMVLIDGVASKRNIGAIQPLDIERIELIENPSAKFEANLASIVNIVLKEERKKGIKVTSNLHYFSDNRFNFSNIQLSYASEKFNVFGMAKLKLSNALSVDSTYRLNKDSNIEYWETSNAKNDFRLLGNIFQYGFDFKPRKDFLINFTGNYETYNSTDKYTNSGYYVNSSGNEQTKINSEYTGENSLHNYTLYLKQKLFKKHTLEWNSNYYHLERNYSRDNNLIAVQPYNPNTFRSSMDANYGLQNFNSKFDYNYSINNKYTLELGVQFYNRMLTSVEKNNLTDELNYNDFRIACFGLWNTKGDKFSYQIGSRFETTTFNINDTVNNNYLNILPSVYALYNLSSKTSIHIGLNSRLNYPKYGLLVPIDLFNADSSVFYTGNPFLKPEEVYKVELKYSFKKKMNYLSLATYYKYKRNLIGVTKEIHNNTIIESPKNYSKCYIPGAILNTQYVLFGAIPMGFSAETNYNFFDDSQYNGFSYNMLFYTEVPLPFDMYLTIDLSKIGREYTISGYNEQSFLLDEIAIGKSVLGDNGELMLSVLYPFFKDQTVDVNWNSNFIEESYNKYYSTTIMIGFYYHFARGRKIKKSKRDWLMERDEK